MLNLNVIENQGKRVLTTQQLAESYGTDSKVISNNFNNNRERYEEDKHFYYLDGEELKQFLQSENLGMQNWSKVRGLYLWTERGALLHAKSLNTDKAWEVYEILIETYYKVKEQEIKKFNSNMKIIQMIHSEVGELIAATSHIEMRVESLENNMTINYSQQLILQDIAKYVALGSMGGKDKGAYKDSSLRSKVFSQVWKDYKEYFQVNSYKNTASVEFEKAKDYLNGWRAQGKLLREIEDINNLLELNV